MDLSLKGLAKRFPQHNIKISVTDGVGLFELLPKKLGTVESASAMWGGSVAQKTFKSAVIKAEELL
jgi:hypothetical protein